MLPVCHISYSVEIRKAREVSHITDETKLRAAKNLAALVAQPSRDKIIPDMFDKRAVAAVAKAVR
jgi:malic enzyme